jgi:hypothetical protein
MIGVILGTTSLGLNAAFSTLEFFKKGSAAEKMDAGEIARDAKNLLFSMVGFFM